MASKLSITIPDWESAGPILQLACAVFRSENTRYFIARFKAASRSSEVSVANVI